MEQKKQIPVVVIGLCKHGLYIVKNFVGCGIPVYVIDSDFSKPSAKTKFGIKLRCDNLYGPELIDLLMDLKEQFDARVPVFPTNDKMVDLLESNREILLPYYHLPFVQGKILHDLKEKEILHNIATKSGLNVPVSVVVSSLEELEEARDRLIFPLAVKPALPMMSFKSRKCIFYEELETQVRTSEALNEKLMIQEWIEGDDRDIYFGAYYISAGGECLAEFSGRKLMSYPPLTGHATATESYMVEELLDEGAKFLIDSGYWGLCSIEFKGLDHTTAKFIEVTVGRTDWWAMCCGINGVDILMAAYNDLTQRNLPCDNKQVYKYIWRDFEFEFHVLIEFLIKGSWSKKEALHYIARKKKDVHFDRNDIRPFLFFMGEIFRVNALKLWKKIVIKGVEK